jgi:hypothetical protein
MNKSCCEECHWFDRFVGGSTHLGLCHGFGPVVPYQTEEYGTEWFSWPIVDEHDWCPKFFDKFFDATLHVEDDDE